MFTFNPIHNNIVIKMRSQSNQVRGGLYMIKATEKVVRWGEIIGVGQGTYDFFGNMVHPVLKPGQLAYVAAHGQHSISEAHETDKIVMANELDIYTTYDPETNAIQPIGHRVEITKIPPPTSVNGLYLTTSSTRLANMAVIRTLGTGLSTLGDKPIPFQVKVGDVVYLNPLNTIAIDLNGVDVNETRYLIDEGSIHGIVPPEVVAAYGIVPSNPTSELLS